MTSDEKIEFLQERYPQEYNECLQQVKDYLYKEHPMLYLQWACFGSIPYMMYRDEVLKRLGHLIPKDN